MNPDPFERELKPRLLPALLREVEARRTRRERGRRWAGAAALLLVAPAAMFTAMRSATPLGIGPQTFIARKPSEPANAIQFIRTTAGQLASWSVRTDPAALARSEARLAPIQPEWLDDDALLRLLASIGRPTGIVRTGGRVWLTADVADRAPSQPG